MNNYWVKEEHQNFLSFNTSLKKFYAEQPCKVVIVRHQINYDNTFQQKKKKGERGPSLAFPNSKMFVLLPQICRHEDTKSYIGRLFIDGKNGSSYEIMAVASSLNEGLY